MKILAFAASNSKTSINKELARFTAGLVPGAEVELLDLNDYDLPLYSTDREAEIGVPDAARTFFDKIGAADAVVVSYAEHNGSYTAAYKNLFDWASRIDQKVYQDKPALFLSTSPGPAGAASVLAAAKGSAPFFGVDLRGAVSVGSFYDVYDADTGTITADEVLADLTAAAEALTTNAVQKDAA
ncbi:NAD(P)H-dependent oxidoreductase [Rhodovulum sp. FJ3]|uniref:NADPH-dependent FMN reductase n=1 Tax=Rhodovulum sp. FJ3 TaxID=3079053 RepID=UPI00293DE444|nr:NAD(P)H-dependent oxidoreductase [Rhodovulum sp. FJ3]MDV4168121.1 NAD(P)H-dependent oxidoreductase [Rhodovulum sp. FJ3]